MFEEGDNMLTIICLILLAVFAFRILGIGISLSWSIGVIILSIVLFPVIMLVLMFAGLVFIALPIIAIALIVSAIVRL